MTCIKSRIVILVEKNAIKIQIKHYDYEWPFYVYQFHFVVFFFKSSLFR